MHDDDAEVAGVVRLLLARDARLIAIGHGRDDASAATADAFALAWEAAGGELAARVDWAPAGASWLRQARRLTSGQPDAWVIADTAEGFAPMARRLRASTDWDPGRTVFIGRLVRSDPLSTGEPDPWTR